MVNAKNGVNTNGPAPYLFCGVLEFSAPRDQVRVMTMAISSAYCLLLQEWGFTAVTRRVYICFLEEVLVVACATCLLDEKVFTYSGEEM